MIWHLFFRTDQKYLKRSVLTNFCSEYESMCFRKFLSLFTSFKITHFPFTNFWTLVGIDWNLELSSESDIYLSEFFTSCSSRLRDLWLNVPLWTFVMFSSRTYSWRISSSSSSCSSFYPHVQSVRNFEVFCVL